MANNILLSRIFNFTIGLTTIIINGIIAVVPINGGRLIDRDDSLNKFMPSPAAFLIWSIIYMFKLAFMIYQLLPRTYNLKYINYGIIPYFSTVALLNMTWLITQAYLKNNYNFVQLIILYIMFIVLFSMYTTTFKYIKKDLIMKIESNDNFYLNYWFGRVWLSMYFAWITGAICVDSFSVFSDLPTSTYISSSLTLCLLTIITMFVLHINRDIVFSLTFIWFTSWIIVHNKEVKEAYTLIITSIVVLSIISIITVIIFALNIKFIINRYKGIETELESERFPSLLDYFKRPSNYNSLD